LKGDIPSLFLFFCTFQQNLKVITTTEEGAIRADIVVTGDVRMVCFRTAILILKIFSSINDPKQQKKIKL